MSCLKRGFVVPRYILPYSSTINYHRQLRTCTPSTRRLEA